MTLQLEHADFYYRLGMVQGKADQLGDDIRNEVARHEIEMERIRLMSGQSQVTSAAVATSAGISDSKIIYLIRQTPRLNKLFTKLSVEGKRRVLRLANGTDFLLAETLQDVLEQERGN